ncbi:MAG: DUF1905 domain-containing protein [Ilumatobacteraceae bacterium]
MTALRITATLEPRGPAGAFVLSDDQVAALGDGKRAFAVAVTVNGTTVPLRLARMGGENLIGLAKAARTTAGVEIGSSYEIEVVADTGERTVEVPDDLAAALAADPDAKTTFGAMAYSHRKSTCAGSPRPRRPTPAPTGSRGDRDDPRRPDPLTTCASRTPVRVTCAVGSERPTGGGGPNSSSLDDPVGRGQGSPGRSRCDGRRRPTPRVATDRPSTWRPTKQRRARRRRRRVRRVELTPSTETHSTVSSIMTAHRGSRRGCAPARRRRAREPEGVVGQPHTPHGHRCWPATRGHRDHRSSSCCAPGAPAPHDHASAPSTSSGTP